MSSHNGMRRAVLALGLVAGCTGSDENDLSSAPIDAPECVHRTALPPDHCPNSGCPQTFTTDPAKVCPSDPRIIQPVTFWTGCDGFDVIEYNGVDTGQEIFFRASDGGFVGYGGFSILGATCVPGVPADFSLSSCAMFTSTACGHLAR
jgi:hypothetical protein